MREEELVSTISATFAQIKVTIEDANLPTGSAQVKLQLWDTAGDEKLRSITRNYFNGASAALIVYDVTSEDSLKVAKDWIDSLRQNAPSDCLLILVGNKSDLIEQVEVSRGAGQSFANENNLDNFFETSARENTGISELFKYIAG